MGRYTGKISIRNLADQNRNNDNSGNEYNIYKMKESNRNPFKQNNDIAYSINLRNEKPVAYGDSITLREIFNGDVDDKVNITKKSINFYASNENKDNNIEHEEIEDEFDFPDENDIKSLNEVSSSRYVKNSNNRNGNLNINTYNNNNYDIGDINALISDNEDEKY